MKHIEAMVVRMGYTSPPSFLPPTSPPPAATSGKHSKQTATSRFDRPTPRPTSTATSPVVMRLCGGGGPSDVLGHASGLGELVETGILKRSVASSGGAIVVTICDGSSRCEEHAAVLESHGFQRNMSDKLVGWTNCALVPGARVLVAGLLESGWLSAVQERSEMLLRDGAGRTRDVTTYLKADTCRWDATTRTWRCVATPERRAALSTARARMPPEERILLRVELAVGRQLRQWPVHFATAARAPRIGFREEKHASGTGRHAFCCFLLHNGCGPTLLVEWLTSRGCIKRDAWCEIKATIQKLERGQPCGSTWDLRTSKRVDTRMPDDKRKDVQRALEMLPDTAPGEHKMDLQPPPSGCAAYYSGIFPLEDVARLLHRDGSPFQLREVALDNRVLRSRPVLSLEKFQSVTSQVKPTSVHVGAAYDPDSQAQRCSEALGTELVLEIDDVPECVASDDKKRWAWLRHAVSITLYVLRRCFGVHHVLAFASGNRGPHLWVLDSWVLCQSAAERSEFFARLQRPTHEPWWDELASDRLLPFVEQHLTRPASEGGFGLQPEQGPLSADKLRLLAYPQLDSAVATQPTHLHRLPFSVHEKTGRVAVPFAESTDMPHCTADLPLVSDPQLVSKLAKPLAVLRAAAECVSQHAVLELNASVAPVMAAPWTIASSRKRSRTSVSADSCDVAPLRIDKAAAAAWSAELLAAANDALAASPSVTSVSEAIESVVRDGCADRVSRMRREAAMVEKLVTAVSSSKGFLHGETYTKGDGRTLTHYPQLDQAQFVQRLAKATRHAVTAHAYYELDFSTAHLAIAWSAVEKHWGAEEAAGRCPSLKFAAVDKQAARKKVAVQCVCSEGTAKKLILAALNQESNTRCAFLSALCDERKHVRTALQQHPLIAGEQLQAIRQRCDGESKPAVRELSLMLQTIEGAMLRLAVRVLGEQGYETGALIADGLLARRTHSGLANSFTTVEALRKVTAAVEQRIRDEFGIMVEMGCEHAACE